MGRSEQQRRGWRLERGGVGGVTHASLMGWTDWTCVIQMPRTNITTLAAKPFRKGALRSFVVKAVKAKKANATFLWIRKVQGTKLRTSLNANII